MHSSHARTLLASAAAVVLTSLTAPAFATDAKLSGTPALAGETAQVSGILSVQEAGPLARTLELVMTDAETGEPITAFDEELTQELHVIAVDSAFSTFVHEHAGQAGPDGRFRVDVRFPKPGLYHVYADAIPTGLGQQVLRFDLEVGADQDVSATRPEPQSGDVLSAPAGPYTVDLDVSELRAGEDSALELRILKDGRPAEDLSPYLGVPAHAVFIATEDLAYVHAHATAAEPSPSHGSGGHGHGGHASGQTEEVVPSSLSLHATPPAPGTYALWIQFRGGGEVRTAPFIISVQEAEKARS